MGLSLQVLSNLHLELNDIINFENIITPCADMLVLLGDIGSPTQTSLVHFLHWCSINFGYVLYVPGNTEYYSFTGEYDMAVTNESLCKICDKFPNVYFLSNDTLLVDKKYVFIGTTLWSDVPIREMADLSDFKYIYKTPNVLITHDDVCDLYQANKKWIEDQIVSAIDCGLIPIVLTHHQSFLKQCHTKRHSIAVEPSMIRMWCTANPTNTHTYNDGYLLYTNRYMNMSTMQQQENFRHAHKLHLD